MLKEIRNDGDADDVEEERANLPETNSKGDFTK
jgi:hypothetical protein